MARKSILQIVGIALGLCVLTACSLISPEASFAATHPQELGAGRPICSECHSNDVAKGETRGLLRAEYRFGFAKKGGR